MNNTRGIAIECLVRILDRGDRADRVLDEVFASGELSSADRGFVHELVYGVLRRFFSLEADASRFIRNKPALWTRMALLAGTYQLRHMRVPVHAAVHETVESVKRSPVVRDGGMVNAILRRVADAEPPTRLKPHQRCELPKWLYAKWRDAFGAEVVQTIAAHCLHAPALSIALSGDTDREAWIAEADKRGIEAQPGRLSPRCVLLESGIDVVSLPGFAEGRCLVMDQAAQLAALALGEERGHVLDLCAAPGGKTALLASRVEHVTAVEFSASRFPRLRQNLSRLRVGNVSLLQADAASLPMPDQIVDGVLLDAPCSASGVLRRHPDAKFLHAEADLERHTVHQSAMLHEALRVLRPGGRVVYTVCSIHPDENEGVVMPLLESGAVTPDILGDALQPFAAGEGMARLFPDEAHDGFFIACLRKA
ncbi:MAG TPA: transcription antitermination factor NusB [Mariprofundaceae bacterium]|nr:transcription antitermination factor NusB [Mariprofundaceae bacterium]